MKTLFKYFLVEACSVKTCGQTKFDITFQICICGSSPYTCGIESLIEYKAQITGLIIEKEFISFDMHLAHTGIRIDMINHFSFGIQYFQFDVV